MTEKVKSRLMDRKGFTLIELIVVIAIIAILAAVLIPRFTGFTESGRKKAVLSDARNILVALDAADANGEITAASTDAATAESLIEKYVGKDIISCTDALDANGESTITAVTKGTNGLGFTYSKQLGTKIYTVAVSNSTLPADAS
ncbi:prepilin-type N-terminal cleavage/methylation domain-containing protein [Papillibacter cinnamivorans]|uniref:Prepilin-type N-terminal cleavage/methylation domain-containing protein n=1 Tax=Papillibacter cinnamivorans DSM 12816 TaxID=1122930 RepID=A0A1W1Z2S3_9FIRM|nr:prepilin-type N-terminal cleavage/methylation domain-containing protein [Papillibacter cinnamivorans]SMC42686.1 prepilin-type N-terminal cleavage/methylation domain-containing protein [Papillibacter cinnamivorans DSM 12816]